MWVMLIGGRMQSLAMETQTWDDRGRLTVRPDFRQRLGPDARFIQVLTPGGILFLQLRDKPEALRWGGALKDLDGAERRAGKESKEQHDRLRRRQPRHRRR